jgi:iron complex outermembrane receptor protein
LIRFGHAIGRGGRCLGTLALAAGLGLSVHAAPAPELRHFEIAAGAAEETLPLFSQQAMVELVFSFDKVAGVRTQGIVGDFTPVAALARILDGTPLVLVQDPGSGALAVNRRSESNPPKSDASAPLAPGVRSGPVASVDPNAAPSSDEVVRLPQFTVSSAAGSHFRPTDTISAVRIRGDLVDTPVSIAVITRDLMQELGANSIYDATRYFSGISNGRGAGAGGILDRQDFRGFESFARTVDGISTFLIPGNNGFQGNFEPEFSERIEVVKGPDSILSPTGSPGGSVNVITKSPLSQPSNELTVQGGNYDAGKVSIDSTGPLPLGGGGKWSYRLIADYQDGQTFVPGSLRQQNMSAQLKFQPTDQTEVTVKYFGQQWELTGAIANPNDDGWYVTDPGSIRGATLADLPPPDSGFTYRGWNGDTTWSDRFDRTNLVTAEMTSALFDCVSMRLNAAFLSDDFDQNAGYLSAAPPTESWDAVTGQEIAIGNNFNPASAAEIANHVKSTNRDVQVQNDYAANFHPGGVFLQPVAGWSYQHGRNPSDSDRTAPLPNVDLLSPLAYDPPRPVDSAYTTATATSAHAWQSQVYAFAKAGFYDERLFLVGGASRVWTNSASTNLLTGTQIGLDGNHDTYLGGILAKPVSNLSLYYLFSSNAAITNGPNAFPVWETGKQNEVGAKTEFFNQRLSLTAARFGITQNNLASPNPLYNTDPAHNPINILTDETNQGYEFELVGALTPNLSIISSHTEMRLRDAFGRRQRNVPDTTSAVLLEYRFISGPLQNLVLFAGGIHNGNSAGETVTGFTSLGVPEQPGFYVSGWTVYNAGTGYRWGRYSLNLNVDNLLNSRFIWQPTGRNSVSPYPGTAVRLTTSVHF